MGAAPRAEARQWCARVQDPLLLEIVKRGTLRSVTFRSLVAELERSNIVVHLRRSDEARPGSGFTQFVIARGDRRFIRITLNVAKASDSAVALLGHELQHAAELAAAPHVTDATAYAALYASIGHRSCNRQWACYDTFAAVNAGSRVLSELRG
jgi:hypothetical protein